MGRSGLFRCLVDKCGLVVDSHHCQPEWVGALGIFKVWGTNTHPEYGQHHLIDSVLGLIKRNKYGIWVSSLISLSVMNIGCSVISHHACYCCQPWEMYHLPVSWYKHLILQVAFVGNFVRYQVTTTSINQTHAHFLDLLAFLIFRMCVMKEVPCKVCRHDGVFSGNNIF